MAALIAAGIATGLAGLAVAIPTGIFSIVYVCKWAENHKEEAIDYFWKVKIPDICQLPQDSQTTLQPWREGQSENVPDQPKASKHRQRIHDMEVQEGLCYGRLSSERL